MAEGEGVAAGVKVEGRMVPFPKSISPQARAALASLVGPDGQPMDRGPTLAADDFEGWARAKVATNEHMMRIMAPRSGALKSSVETIDLGGAVVHLATPKDAGPDDCAYYD